MKVMVDIPTKDEFCNDCEFQMGGGWCTHFKTGLAINVKVVEPLRCKECLDLEKEKGKKK
jgi:hypothetical protein